jgi:hypothetical protein
MQGRLRKGPDDKDRARAELVEKFGGEEGLEIVQRVLSGTWQQIGNDCVEANEGKEPNLHDTCEIVLDANYAETHARTDVETAVLKLLRELPYAGPVSQFAVAKMALS